MSDGTGIEWTDATWSVTRGCSRVSPGCGGSDGGGCYAERMAHRFSGPGMPFEGLTRATAGGPRWTGKIRLVPEALDEPLRWRKPRRVFVNSMSDLFHEGVPDDFIAQVFAVMALAPRHTFQILSKRAQRMATLLGSDDFWQHVNEWSDLMLEDEESPVGPGRGWNGLERRSDDARAQAQAPTVDEPLANAWVGVSVENQDAARARVPWLLDTPAAVRFISAEPLLGPVDLTAIEVVAPRPPHGPGVWLDALRGHVKGPDDMLPAHVGWVIVGGESGPGARPCDLDWIRSLVKQCRSAGTKAFVKQLGARAVTSNPDDKRLAGDMMLPDGFRLVMASRKGGDPEEWTEDLRVREMPEVR